MRKLYLLRNEDLHGHSGTGTVAEGVIFHNGMVALTWFSEWETMTTFKNVQTLKRLHSHEGRTEIIIEGVKKDAKRFECCQDHARSLKAKKKHSEDNESD
jgi:hypothetical protein